MTDGHGRVAGDKENREIPRAKREDGRDAVQLAREWERGGSEVVEVSGAGIKGVER